MSRFLKDDRAVLLAFALGIFLLHLATNSGYGFHRDELATIDDSKHLAWGYVAYPPFTPFVARVASALFGISTSSMHLFPTLAMCIAFVLTGLMARDIGGGRWAQVVAALAAGISPIALAGAALLQYVAFDYLWWVVAAFFVVRLLTTNDERYLLGVGAAIGLGGMTKYTMLLLMAGIVLAFVLTRRWRYFAGQWFWLGAALAFLIVLPNLIWLIQHNFIYLDFVRHIHERDIRLGRTASFFPDQILISTNLFTLPLWLMGLYYFFFHEEGKRYRAVAWMFVIPLALFILAKGRGYYTAPAYPMLFAGGAVWLERRMRILSTVPRRAIVAATTILLLVGFGVVAAVALPAAPIGSKWFQFASSNNGDLVEELGWPELVAEVARIRDTFPAAERPKVGILAANYGEAGAINLYGPQHGLPQALSGINSFWARGYGNPPPETLIVLGFSQRFRDANFSSCELAGHTPNPYNVKNEETRDHPDVFVCRGLKESWPEFWKDFQYFG